MKPITATEQGEYIHCIFKKISTQQDGDAFALFAIDNATKFAYPVHLTLVLDEVAISKHFLNIIQAIANVDAMLHPTFVLGYGEDMLDAIQENFSENATIIFALEEANRIALPAVFELTGGRI